MTCRSGLLYLLAVAPAFAQFSQFSTPNSGYTSGTTLIAITPPNGTSMSTITDGVQTVTLSTALTARTVPGGGWSTWGSPPNTESATPRVLAIYTAVTSFTMTLSAASRIFGFEIEPNTFGVFTITASFMNGATVLGTITRDVNGNAGALLMGASSGPPITSVVVTMPSGTGGFAIAQLRYQLPTATAIPALSPVGVGGLAALLAAAGVMLARRQQQLV